MKTGEGKTLVATLPVYLNALTGRGVHVVTVNDYLAGRDAAWMGPVYEFLGLSVAALQNSMEATERREAYLADITYGTNTEFGFDYLARQHGVALPTSRCSGATTTASSTRWTPSSSTRRGRRSSSPAPASGPPRPTTTSPASPGV